MDPQVKIDGNKLDDVLAETNMLRKEIAGKIGVTPSMLSRWTKRGHNYVRRSNFAKIAKLLNMAPQELLDKVAYTKGSSVSIEDLLTEEEADWLNIYRQLKPLEKAKIRVKVEAHLSELKHRD